MNVVGTALIGWYFIRLRRLFPQRKKKGRSLSQKFVIGRMGCTI